MANACPPTIIGFGDDLLTSFPLEIFSEISRGGYEINSFMYSKDRPEPYCDHADFELIKATVNNINSLIK